MNTAVNRILSADRALLKGVDDNIHSKLSFTTNADNRCVISFLQMSACDMDS